MERCAEMIWITESSLPNGAHLSQGFPCLAGAEVSGLFPGEGAGEVTWSSEHSAGGNGGDPPLLGCRANAQTHGKARGGKTGVSERKMSLTWRWSTSSSPT